VEPAKPKNRESANTHTFELPYENDLDQEELNRRLRKPGEPGYCAPNERAKNTSPGSDHKTSKG
jgi:hypothetical protein